MRVNPHRAHRCLLVVTFALALGGVLLGPNDARARSRGKSRSATFRVVQDSRATPAARLKGPRQPPLIPVPPVRQHSLAACGVASLQALASYYGQGTTRASQYVRQAMGGRKKRSRYTYELGTPEHVMARLAREQGLKPRARRQMRLGDLFGHVKKGIPVIVGYQAWTTSPVPVDWRKVEDLGHYSVVLGFGNRRGKPYKNVAALRKDIKNAVVWLMDPAADLGNRGYLPVKEFMKRWHWTDDAGRPSRFGMAVEGPPGPRQRVFLEGSERIE